MSGIRAGSSGSGGWERSGNHGRSHVRSAALFCSPVRGFICRNMDMTLVAGMWMLSWGQGVAGSNPAVPTGSQLFSNILPLRKSQQKSQLAVQRPLHRPAPRLPRRPTRAGATTAEQASSPIKAPKITEPPRICTTTPDNSEPAGTIPRPPADRRPDAHRGTAATGRGQARVLKPGLLTPPSTRRPPA